MMKTSGFVLRKNDYREYDRIYVVYTYDFGKISLLVRSAKKIKSKLAPALESFGEIKIDFAKGKIFNHLSGSRALKDNKDILKSAEKIELAQDILYLMDRFIKPEEADENIFSHLKIILSAIHDFPAVIAPAPRSFSEVGRRYSDEAIPLQTGLPRPFGARDEILVKISIYFFWKLVELLGYGPRLDECALCGRISSKQQVVSSRVKFNITENIIICSNCVGDGLHIQENTLEDLKKIFKSSLAEFLQTNLEHQLLAITEKAKQIKLSEL